MSRTSVRALLFLCFILVVCSAHSQKNEKEKIKKANVLPVWMSYSGLPSDGLYDSIVKEAFTRHKVKLIGSKEFDELIDYEVSRIVSKFRLRSSEFRNEQELKEASNKEVRVVANQLNINFYYQKTGDTLNVIGARWEVVILPTDVTGGSRSSGKIDTNLDDVCCSARDNIYAIVDKILFSKWLH
jgi:hypothetical protein